MTPKSVPQTFQPTTQSHPLEIVTVVIENMQ